MPRADLPPDETTRAHKAQMAQPQNGKSNATPPTQSKPNNMMMPSVHIGKKIPPTSLSSGCVMARHAVDRKHARQKVKPKPPKGRRGAYHDCSWFIHRKNPMA
mmetsp:Transcript_85223/g.134574  ORF Transcript_85223/g.134574 Transcript_85223/m.134574 type:complete len:103 (-) Transcript_85223:470-778(-)